MARSPLARSIKVTVSKIGRFVPDSPKPWNQISSRNYWVYVCLTAKAYSGSGWIWLRLYGAIFCSVLTLALDES